MSSPLQQLLESGRAELVGAGDVDAFFALGGPALLLLTGDPAQRPEAQDVAVIAGELARAHPALRLAVAEPRSEEALKARFKVPAVPAVLFAKNGRVLSTLARVQPWDAYARAAAVLFGRPEVTP